jgi:hypothetical protein
MELRRSADPMGTENLLVAPFLRYIQEAAARPEPMAAFDRAALALQRFRMSQTQM